MCLRPMLCVTIKLFQLAFPIKRKRWTLTPCLLLKRRFNLSLEFVGFVIRKISVKLMWGRFFLLVYLAQGYESIRNFFLQIDRCAEFILATAKNKFRIICKDVTICSVCRWCIFSLSLSFTDFISSISEWLTAVPEVHNFFYRVVFKALSKLTLCFNIIPSNYRPKNDMVISPIKEVIK